MRHIFLYLCLILTSCKTQVICPNPTIQIQRQRPWRYKVRNKNLWDFGNNQIPRYFFRTYKYYDCPDNEIKKK